jgi:hypothetical protein
MAQQSIGLQGITQVSVLGQTGASLLPQLLRRLRAHSEHEATYTMNEDVLGRGTSGLSLSFVDIANDTARQASPSKLADSYGTRTHFESAKSRLII